MALIDDVKKELRISNIAYNTEITDLIAAAKADLGLSGVLNSTLDTDTLIKRAIMLYCKANFGYNNPDADRLQKSYDMLKGHLSLSTEYAFYSIAFSTGVEGATVIFDGEELTTGAAGTVIFFCRAKNQIEYTVSAEGYLTVEDTVDITESTTINVVMTAG